MATIIVIIVILIVSFSALEKDIQRNALPVCVWVCG